MNKPVVVTPEIWLQSRQQLLVREKSALQELDAVAQQRRELPWVRVEKSYQFEIDEGTRVLADLFGDHSQLIVYHFMFGPDWNNEVTSATRIDPGTASGLARITSRAVDPPARAISSSRFPAAVAL